MTNTAPQYASLRDKIRAESIARRERYQAFETLYARAHTAGHAAATACTPQAMLVTEQDGTPIELVTDGACGFAWINIRPANCSFAMWLKKTGRVRDGRAYEGGVNIWVSAYGQSMARKEAYAGAFADVLREADIKAYRGSRLD